MYNDPLHIPSAEYTLWHNGKEALILNKRLLDSQNVWTNVTTILELHSERLHLEDMMIEVNTEFETHSEAWIISDVEDREDLLYLYNCLYTQIEFDLQAAWGFSQDKNFHKFWNRPGCTCPRMDNNDRYPYGSYIKQGGCRIHGFCVRNAIANAEAKHRLNAIEAQKPVNKIKTFFKGLFS